MDKAEFLSKARALPTKTIEVPQVGEVIIRALSKRETDTLKGLPENDIAERVVKIGTLNQDGTLLFQITDDLSDVCAGIIKTICDEICELSGIITTKKND